MKSIDFVSIEKRVLEKFKESPVFPVDSTEQKLINSIAMVASRIATMVISEYHKEVSAEKQDRAE